jgi:hypothetical protein
MTIRAAEKEREGGRKSNTYNVKRSK